MHELRLDFKQASRLRREDELAGDELGETLSKDARSNPRWQQAAEAGVVHAAEALSFRKN